MQCESEKNARAYEEALEKAEAVRRSKHAKRQQIYRRLQRQNRTVVAGESSDDEPSLPTQTRDSLFVQDQTPVPQIPSTAEPLRPQQSPIARRLPLEQSSSEEESASDEEKSLTRKAAQHKEVASATNGPKSSPGLAKKKPETAMSTTTPKTLDAYNKPEHDVRLLPASIGARHDESVASSSFSGHAGRPSAASNTMRAIRTAPRKHASHAIGFIDQPREKQKREYTTDQQYSRASVRWRAEKKARTENAPDFDALTFVNGPPSTLPKVAALRLHDDNPYGRRETGALRVQEDSDGERLRRGGADEPTPLAAWEMDKVPLVCFHWKSSTCPYNPQDCRFMHREFDPDGRPYAIGDYNGYVPQKYRKPPITCPYWYKGRKCFKTVEECSYAHQDTGWAELNGVPYKIADLPPEYLVPTATRGPSNFVPPKLQDPPITCSFWLRDPNGCFLSEAECKHAHWNTGWARPGTDPKGQPSRIDPDLKPRGGPPKFANPPVTCPFWFRSEKGCTRADNECKWAHWNTGWAPPNHTSKQVEPIDPHQLPRSQCSGDQMTTSNTPPARLPLKSTSGLNKSLTCPSWLRDLQGCSKPEEDCEYAHRNTGWATPKGRPFEPPVALDPNQTPRFYRGTVSAIDHAVPKNGSPPITCFFWLKGPRGCDKTAANCRFAHRNTGWVNHELASDSGIEKIDPALSPLFRKPGKCSSSAGSRHHQQLPSI